MLETVGAERPLLVESSARETGPYFLTRLRISLWLIFRESSGLPRTASFIISPFFLASFSDHSSKQRRCTRYYHSTHFLYTCKDVSSKITLHQLNLQHILHIFFIICFYFTATVVIVWVITKLFFSVLIQAERFASSANTHYSGQGWNLGLSTLAVLSGVRIILPGQKFRLPRNTWMGAMSIVPCQTPYGFEANDRKIF